MATPIIELPAVQEPDEQTPPEEFRVTKTGWIVRVVVFGLIVLGVLAIPLIVDEVQANRVSGVAVTVLVALSLNLLVGYAGQVSLGHGALLGVGAFACGIGITNLGMPWEVAVVAAMTVGGLVALVLGVVALRVKGLYLALVTMAFAVLAEVVLFNIQALTRGGAGMPAARPSWAQTDISFVYVCFAAIAVVWLLDWRLTSSRLGRAVQAIRDSEQVAASWGINVTAHKLIAFVLSGMIAGLAGGLFVSIEQIASPLDFPFLDSLLYLLMVIFGGMGSRPGVVVGAAILGSLSFVLDLLASSTDWWPQVLDGSAEPLVAAVLVLFVLLWVPGGLAQLLRPVFRWLSFGPLTARGGDHGGS